MGEARSCCTLELVASHLLPVEVTSNLLPHRPSLLPLAQPKKVQRCLTGGTPRVRVLADAAGLVALKGMAGAMTFRSSTKRQGCRVGQTCSGLPCTPGAA